MSYHKRSSYLLSYHWEDSHRDMDKMKEFMTEDSLDTIK